MTAPEADEQRCGNCRFFAYLEGECRQRSPRGTGWPETFDDRWCGEYEPNGTQFEAYRRDGYVTGLLEARDQWSESQAQFWILIDDIITGLGTGDEL